MLKIIQLVNIYTLLFLCSCILIIIFYFSKQRPKKYSASSSSKVYEIFVRFYVSCCVLRFQVQPSTSNAELTRPYLLNQNENNRYKSAPQFGNVPVPNSNMSSFNSSLPVPPTTITTARDVTPVPRNERKKNISIIIYLLLLPFYTYAQF